MYHVECKVSGGVTGTRTGTLRSDGKIVEFETFEAAQAEAVRLQKASNERPYGTASFRYKAIEHSFFN